jgi:hypothetical protein
MSGKPHPVVGTTYKPKKTYLYARRLDEDGELVFNKASKMIRKQYEDHG